MATKAELEQQLETLKAVLDNVVRERDRVLSERASDIADLERRIERIESSLMEEGQTLTAVIPAAAPLVTHSEISFLLNPNREFPMPGDRPARWSPQLPTPMRPLVERDFWDDEDLPDEQEATFLRVPRVLWPSLMVLGFLAGLTLWWGMGHGQPASAHAPLPVPPGPSAAATTRKRAPATLAYVVRGSETFDSLGVMFHLKAGSIRLANELAQGSTLHEGQQLVIPPADGAFFRAKDDETTSGLAKRFDTTEAAIEHFNPGLGTSHLATGRRVFVPGAEAIRVKYREVASHFATVGQR